ncbi:MAG: MTH1187 family thiamine-binding protein [Burkholderiaceae bacterium]|nr:MTH1187 family thiamine-binding protein [Burkholderiaceae bacterium]
MVLLEFAMAPVDKGEELVEYVARILDIIDKSGVPYKLTPMSTILEGEWDQVMTVVSACFRELEKDCHRISTNIKIDYRAGGHSRIQSKIDAVESRLGRKLST